MAASDDKENIARGLLADLDAAVVQSAPPKSPLAQRKSGRSKAKSLGGSHTVHGLTIPLNKESTNRRKSAIAPAVRSILSGKEDEDEAKKRKDARRKSLANRRVSFAPEATLHTWDVIEYLRDGNTTTSSSSSSNNTLNSTDARSPSHGTDSDGTAPIDPTSPTHDNDDTSDEGGSAVSQRQRHQQKQRRRSSTGRLHAEPESPTEIYSSSPMVGSSSPSTQSPLGEPMSDSESELGSEDDQTGTAMSLDIDDVTAQSILSNASVGESTGSSSRLDEALRQAARQAGTQAIEYDEQGEMSMEMAGDEVTNAFKPWMQQSNARPDAEGGVDKENIDPFSPAQVSYATRQPKQVMQARLSSSSDEADMSMDMSVDITRAVGGIMPQSSSSDRTNSDATISSDTMDLTRVIPGSGIISTTVPEPQSRRTSLKRRRSSAVATAASDTGSPAKKPATGRRMSVRASRRRSSLASSLDATNGDRTRDHDVTLATIPDDDPSQQLLMEQAAHLAKEARVPELAEEDMSMSAIIEEAPMDMTVMVGGIMGAPPNMSANGDADEGMSMDMTVAIGKIQANKKVTDEAKSPAQTARDLHGQSWSFPGQDQPSLQQTSNDLAVAEETRTAKSPSIVVERTPPRPSSSSREENKVSIPATPVTPVAATPTGKGARRTRSSIKKTPTPKSSKLASPEKAEPANPETPSNKDVSQRSSPSKPQETADQLSASASVTKLDNDAESQSLPPPVRSPLAPKSDVSTNRLGGGSNPPRLLDSIKQLATPRKQVTGSPLKRLVAATTPRMAKSPTKSPSPVKHRTRSRTTTPQKSVRVMADAVSHAPDEQLEEGPKIALRDFLSMTGIQFLDLTTTKRRHTGFPTLAKRTAAEAEDEDVAMGGDGLDDLERSVIAASTLLPELTMYQHSCHEMKSYLSTGRDVVRSIEAEVLEEQPALFAEYATAPPNERAIMDDQFRAMKTNARLQSKGTWYQWRSQLLKDLSRALDQTEAGMNEDASLLARDDKENSASLASLTATADTLREEVAKLERRKAERESGEQEQLNGARSRIVELDAETLAKRLRIEELRSQIQAQEQAVELATEQKEECVAAIKEAERIIEECRGWSDDEVAVQRARAKQIRSAHHWSVVSASGNPATMTLCYRDCLELFIHPLAFQDARSPESSPSKTSHGNAPIFLSYNADAESSKASPEPSTSQRFFLQLLRAQLISLPQASTKISALLRLVSQGWEKCRALTEAIRQLEMLGPTEVNITGDERIQVITSILLPQVDTKVRVTFDMEVSIGRSTGSDVEIDARFAVKARVVYGEKYDEPKMSDFLKTFCGEGLGDYEKAGAWADAVDDLKQRLIKRGRKT